MLSLTSLSTVTGERTNLEDRIGSRDVHQRHEVSRQRQHTADYGSRRNGRDGQRHDEAQGQEKWGKNISPEGIAEKDKEPEPDFGLSGALAAETNIVE